MGLLGTLKVAFHHKKREGAGFTERTCFRAVMVVQLRREFNGESNVCSKMRPCERMPPVQLYDG